MKFLIDNQLQQVLDVQLGEAADLEIRRYATAHKMIIIGDLWTGVLACLEAGDRMVEVR